MLFIVKFIDFIHISIQLFAVRTRNMYGERRALSVCVCDRAFLSMCVCVRV